MGGITLTDDEQAAAPEDAPPPGPDHPADAPAQRHVRLVFGALVLALLLAALQQTAVAPFLPGIADELGGTARSVWVIAAPVLAAAVTLPVHGKLGDLRGRKGVFQTALVLFVAGSALAGWSRTMDQLIACRALQGIGGAGLLAGAHALTADLVPAPARARFLGVLGAALGAATVAGPAVGEAVRVSWRWVFYANAPLGLLVLIVVGAALRPIRPPYADERRRFDVLGALLLATASTSLVLLAIWAGTRYAWDSRVILGLACGAAGTLLLFFVAEHYAAEPLVPFGLARPLLLTGLVGAAAGTALYAAAGWLPALLPPGGALPPLVPLAGGIVLGSLVSGQLIARTGHHRIHPVFGSAVAAVGVGLLSRLEPGTPVLDHSVWQAVLGTGVGLVLPALVAAVQQAAPPADLGAATAAHLQVRLLGGCLGAAAVSTLAGGGHVQGHEGVTPRLFVVVLVPVLVLGLSLACFLKEKPLVSQNVPTASTASVPAARTPANAAAPASAPAPDGPAWPSSAPYGSGVPVCGAVQHHDGSCVPRAALTLVDDHGRQIGRGASGDDGRYALSVPGPGAYVLIAAAPGHQPQAVSVTVTTGDRPVELDIVLGGAGRLAGTVVTADGTPVRDAAVTLTDVRGEVVAATRSGRDGGYVMADLVAGEYTLAASAPAFRPVALPVSVQASRETRQIIELAGGALLRGTVRATGGRPVEDARVTLLDAAGNVVDTLITGPDGAFRFADLSSGAYTVIASGYPPVATVLQVAGGGRTERDLQLGHGG
ncbi:MFS transporter [Streptomyces sp. NPDC003036]|uniref:MFS transporter n=1 Tax=Streptomyces sp. NPDC003036 TaxID=3154442 RepID=UPI0033B0F1E2